MAVTVSETTDKAADARLRIASVFSAGIGGKEGESTATVSRVRFKVPIALPVNAASSARVKEVKRKLYQPLPKS